MSEYPISRTAFLSRAQTEALELLSDEAFWNYAVEVAHSVNTPDKQFEEYLVCDMGKIRCVLPTVAFCSVIPLPSHFTLLPASPPWMFGIAAWRGTPIAVVDLGAYLLHSTAQHLPGTMLLVVQYDDIILGWCGSVLGSIDSLPEEQIKEFMPSAHPMPHEGAIKGVYTGNDVMLAAGMENALVLDVPVILADIVQRLKVTTSYA